jgi:dephospho-CoA kinase
LVYKVGLIGGIACGKTAALHYFKSLGIDTFSADDIARQLTQKNSHCFQTIISHCGPDYLLPNGELNRDMLRQRLIKDPDFKLWLENLLHPLIQTTLIENMKACQTPYCIVEIPLLKDKSHYDLDRVLYIKASPKFQKSRLVTRGLSDAHINGMLQVQIPAQELEGIADDIVINDKSLNALHKQIDKLHQFYLSQG